MNRKIDYYIKGFRFDVRQDIWEALDNINPVTVKNLLGKPDGYPGLKIMSFSDSDIAEYIKNAALKFKKANDLMVSNGGRPLFSNPEDTYSSSLEYTDMMTKRTEEELLDIFGCSWDDYDPEQYMQLNDEKKTER